MWIALFGRQCLSLIGSRSQGVSLSLTINCAALDKEDFARNYSIDTAEIEYNNNAVLFLVESV